MSSTLSDNELIQKFEDCTASEEEWTHRAHVRAGWLYVTQLPFEEAVDKMRKGLQALNEVLKAPNELDRGYHETITVAFMRLIHAVAAQKPYPDSEAFCDAHPELLSKAILRTHYSREQIMTWEAKQYFVEPDLKPLPTMNR